MLTGEHQLGPALQQFSVLLKSTVNSDEFPFLLILCVGRAALRRPHLCSPMRCIQQAGCLGLASPEAPGPAGPLAMVRRSSARQRQGRVLRTRNLHGLPERQASRMAVPSALCCAKQVTNGGQFL